MANDKRNWIGGAAKSTHVMTATIANTWAGADTIRTEIIDEGGNTKFVQTTTTSSTIETGVLDPHLADLQADTQTVFAAVTWTKSGTDKIVATAKLSGKPLSGGSVTNVVVDASTTAGNGDVTWALTTASAGPHDANTDANWTDATPAAQASPTDDDDVKILPHPTDVDFAGNPISYPILYGLDQSSIDLKTFRVGRSYEGQLGDPIQGFFFQIDCKWPAGASGKTVIDSRATAIWLKGSHDEINIAGSPAGKDAIRLAGGTISLLRLIGSRILGKTTIIDSTIVPAIEAFGFGGEVEIGTETGTPTTSIDLDGGRWVINRPITGGGVGRLRVMGGEVIHNVGDVTLADNYGALMFLNSGGTIAKLENHNGTTNFEQNKKHQIIVSAAEIWAGQILDQSGLANVSWSADIIKHGGLVLSDTGTTIAFTA